MSKPVFRDATETDAEKAIKAGDEKLRTKYRIEHIHAYGNKILISFAIGENVAEKIVLKSGIEQFRNISNETINSLEKMDLGLNLYNRSKQEIINSDTVIQEILSDTDTSENEKTVQSEIVPAIHIEGWQRDRIRGDRADKPIHLLTTGIKAIAPRTQFHGWAKDPFWADKLTDNRVIGYITIHADDLGELKWSELLKPLKELGCHDFYVALTLYDGNGVWNGYDLTGRDPEHYGPELEADRLEPTDLPARRHSLTVGFTTSTIPKTF